MNTSNVVKASSSDIAKVAASPIICRINRTTNQPIVFFTHSLDTGRLTGFADGTLREFGVDFYTTTLPVSTNDSLMMAKGWAEYAGIPADLVAIRERLPRTHRVIQDRLAVVPAVVETPQEKAVKMAIKRNAKAVSKRSQAALNRYHQDVQATLSKMAEQTLPAPTTGAVSDEERQQKVLILASKIAELLAPLL